MWPRKRNPIGRQTSERNEIMVNETELSANEHRMTSLLKLDHLHIHAFLINGALHFQPGRITLSHFRWSSQYEATL